MSTLAIVPARYASTRFPGKPLIKIGNKTMIQRVVERALSCGLFERLIVATDDRRIFDHVTSLGYEVVMTSGSHQSGTDRCAEALLISGINANAVVNIQGDEPLVHPDQLRKLVELIQLPDVDIATLVKPIIHHDLLFDLNKVKVVLNKKGNAIYFSRQAIPLQRGIKEEQWAQQGPYYQHLGLYAFKSSVLKEVVQLPVSYLERSESLEQLRWLENGWSIRTGLTDIETPSIDTPEDLERLLMSQSFLD
jgi:3-deoxy-manno-octulosonate cytidylyltransferase (CMP-KDO synthetase)